MLPPTPMATFPPLASRLTEATGKIDKELGLVAVNIENLDTGAADHVTDMYSARKALIDIK